MKNYLFLLAVASIFCSASIPCSVYAMEGDDKNNPGRSIASSLRVIEPEEKGKTPSSLAEALKEEKKMFGIILSARPRYVAFFCKRRESILESLKGQKENISVLNRFLGDGLDLKSIEEKSSSTWSAQKESVLKDFYARPNIVKIIQEFFGNDEDFNSLSNNGKGLVLSLFQSGLFENGQPNLFPKSLDDRRIKVASKSQRLFFSDNIKFFTGRTFLRYNVLNSPDSLAYALGYSSDALINKVKERGNGKDDVAIHIRCLFDSDFNERIKTTDEDGIPMYSGLQYLTSHGMCLPLETFSSVMDSYSYKRYGYGGQPKDLAIGFAKALGLIENLSVYIWTLNPQGELDLSTAPIVPEHSTGIYHLLDYSPFYERVVGKKFYHFQVLVDEASDPLSRKIMLVRENIARLLSEMQMVEE